MWDVAVESKAAAAAAKWQAAEPLPDKAWQQFGVKRRSLKKFRKSELVRGN